MSLNNVFIILKKEFLELRNSILKVSFLIIFPLIITYLVGSNNGSTGIFNETYTILFAQITYSIYFLNLIKDSMYRERSQNTLEILLTSNLSIYEIIFGKILLVVILTGALLSAVYLWLYSMLSSINSSYLELITINGYLFSLLIVMLTSSLTIILSILINDEKVSEMVSLMIGFKISIGLFFLLFKVGGFYNMIIFFIFALLLFFINIVLLKICSYKLKNSMFLVNN